MKENFFDYDYEDSNESYIPNSIDFNKQNSKFENENIVDKNGQLMEIETCMIDYILTFIDNEFSLSNFSLFKNEKHVLEYYCRLEKKCLDFIEDNFKDKKELHKYFINFANEIIKEKYENNKDISKLKDKIQSGIKKIIEQFEKNDNLDVHILPEIYLKIFETEKIPKFLEEIIIGEIKCFQLVRGLISKDSDDISIDFSESKNIYNNNKDIEDSFIIYYSRFINGEVKPFEIVNKKIMFNILLYSNLKDIYKNPKIKDIFINNYLLIAECLDYYDTEFENEIINNRPMAYIDHKLTKNFNQYEINDLHIYTLASIFYLIMNVMKDINELNNYKKNKFNSEHNNSNNPLFNKILRNVLNSFYIYCPDEQYNFKKYMHLTNYFYKYTIINGEVEKINKLYEMKEIEVIIKKSNLFGDDQYFNELLKKINEPLLLKEKIMNFFSSNKHEESNITLYPVIKNRHSNFITLLISGFLSQDDDLYSWQQFLLYDNNNTNYYLFTWPSSALSLYKLLISYKLFLPVKKKAKYAGKILALFLASNKDFYNFQINLVGFSLGCQVIKYCLKELDKIKGHRDMINNVLFMGGATLFKEKKKNIWRNIFMKNVGGRIINCYSKEDYILKYLFRFRVGHTPIGLRKIDLKDENGEYDIVDDYDLSDLKMGHLDYRNKFDVILKRINFLNDS